MSRISVKDGRSYFFETNQNHGNFTLGCFEKNDIEGANGLVLEIETFIDFAIIHFSLSYIDNETSYVHAPLDDVTTLAFFLCDQV
jgi:hypothetical protein